MLIPHALETTVCAEKEFGGRENGIFRRRRIDQNHQGVSW